MLKCLLLKHLEGKVMRRCLTGSGTVVLRECCIFGWSSGATLSGRHSCEQQSLLSQSGSALGEPGCWLFRLWACIPPEELTQPGWQSPDRSFLGPPPGLHPQPRCAAPVPLRGRCLSRGGFCVPRLPGGWKGKHGRTVRRNKSLEKLSSTVCYRKQQNWKSHSQVQHATGAFLTASSPGWRRA